MPEGKRIVREGEKLFRCRETTWQLICRDRSRGFVQSISEYKGVEALQVCFVDVTGWSSADFGSAIGDGKAGSASGFESAWQQRGRVVRKGTSL